MRLILNTRDASGVIVTRPSHRIGSSLSLTREIAETDRRGVDAPCWPLTQLLKSGDLHHGLLCTIPVCASPLRPRSRKPFVSSISSLRTRSFTNTLAELDWASPPGRHHAGHSAHPFRCPAARPRPRLTTNTRDLKLILELEDQQTACTKPAPLWLAPPFTLHCSPAARPLRWTTAEQSPWRATCSIEGDVRCREIRPGDRQVFRDRRRDREMVNISRRADWERRLTVEIRAGAALADQGIAGKWWRVPWRARLTRRPVWRRFPKSRDSSTAVPPK